jgi:hypothetical protein
MNCELKEKLQGRLVTLNGKLNVLRPKARTTDEERMNLLRARVSLNDEIREHLRCGHDGKRCPA